MLKNLTDTARPHLVFLILVLLTVVPAAAQTPATASRVTVSDNLRAPASGKALADLQSEIRARLLRPELNRGQVGVKIVSLNTGKVLFEENAEKYFMPASNMKNFTVAAALEKLTPDFRFVTSVYAPSMPDASGTIKGDLRVFGRGDVSISTAFSESNYYKGLDELADKIAAAGVKRIEGSIIGDDSYFKGGAIPSSWEWDDLQWYYGAEVSALPLNDNAVDLTVTPGPEGYSCLVKITPYNPVYQVKNGCRTTAAGTPRTLKIEKLLGQNMLEITGTLPRGNAGFSGSVTVTRPAKLFAALLKQRLELKGITVTGRFEAQKAANGHLVAPEGVEIAKLESPPLALIAAKTMKPSQNMYTETLLWTLGEDARNRWIQSGPDGVAVDDPFTNKESAELGIQVVKEFLAKVGIDPDAVVQYDGSGLSRHNLITPSAVVKLYTYMAKQSKYAQAWRDSLTIGGVDGTLRNRFKGTAAEGNMRGKTGTIDQVSALSGYVTTASGEELVVSFLVNGVRTTRDRTSMMDDIVVALAKFDGKID
ncbi:MAG: D-alanyl-D-alanine carboxypeptidase/D-alanyl-D-alanine-endopeptidase [Pyrinomonadaceae bacterium]